MKLFMLNFKGIINYFTCFTGYSSNQMLMVQTDEVIIDIDGASPMAPKETLIILDFVRKMFF